MTTNGQDYDGPILDCKDLCISYFTRAGEIPAVIDFNLTLNQGDSVGLVIPIAQADEERIPAEDTLRSGYTRQIGVGKLVEL